MRIGAFVSGIAVGAAVVLVTMLIGQLTKDTPRPSIFASLPENTLEIEAAVDRAVKATFLVGYSEDWLIADLSDMGFVIRRGDQGLRATYTAGGFGCTETFSVDWSARPDRVIEKASGGYHLSCL